jgi:hypothetical protein
MDQQTKRYHASANIVLKVVHYFFFADFRAFLRPFREILRPFRATPVAQIVASFTKLALFCDFLSLRKQTIVLLY